MRHKPLITIQDVKELEGQLVLLQTARAWRRVGVVRLVNTENGRVTLDGPDGTAIYVRPLGYNTVMFATTDTSMSAWELPQYITHRQWLERNTPHAS